MNPNILCLTDTLTKLAFYAVVAYGIHALKVVVITFINRRATLLDLLAPRTPEEVTIDNVRLGRPSVNPNSVIESEEILPALDGLDLFNTEDEVKH